jgi:hypothetical protein
MRLMGSPQSCTATIFSTWISPVSVSTDTLAACAPCTPFEESPSTHSPRADTPLGPSSAHASRQASLRLEPESISSPLESASLSFEVDKALGRRLQEAKRAL